MKDLKKLEQEKTNNKVKEISDDYFKNKSQQQEEYKTNLQ